MGNVASGDGEGYKQAKEDKDAYGLGVSCLHVIINNTPKALTYEDSYFYSGRNYDSKSSNKSCPAYKEVGFLTCKRDANACGTCGCKVYSIPLMHGKMYFLMAWDVPHSGSNTISVRLQTDKPNEDVMKSVYSAAAGGTTSAKHSVTIPSRGGPVYKLIATGKISDDCSPLYEVTLSVVPLQLPEF